MLRKWVLAEFFILAIALGYTVGVVVTRTLTPVLKIQPKKIEVEADWFLMTAADIYTRSVDIMEENDSRKKEIKLLALLELIELYNKRASEIKEWTIRCPKSFSVDYLFGKDKFRKIENGRN